MCRHFMKNEKGWKSFVSSLSSFEAFTRDILSAICKLTLLFDPLKCGFTVQSIHADGGLTAKQKDDGESAMSVAAYLLQAGECSLLL